MKPSTRPEVVGLVLLASALAAFLVECWEIRPHLDDAYISYRYARNLVAGHGLVYNPGEYVEGYTNLLWTLLVAGGLAAGFTAKQVGHALGVAGGVATLIAATAYARAGAAGARRAWMAGLAPWLLVLGSTLPRWSTSGMETALFSALVTAALAAQARARIGWATLLAGLATATRPEGALVAALVLAPAAGSALRGRAEPARRRRTLLCIAGYAAALGLLTLFRLVYYGAPLPNTFYAKAGAGSLEAGLHYAAGFLRTGPGFLLPPALMAALLEPRWRPGLSLVAAYMAYVVLVGGDVFGYRLILPVLPALVVLAVAGVGAAWERRREAGVGLAACLPAAAGTLQFEAFPLSLALALAAGVLLAWLGLRVRRPVGLWAGAAAAVATLALWPAEPGGSQLGDLASRVVSPARRATLEQMRKRGRAFELQGRRQARRIRQRGEDVRLVATGAIGSFGYHADFAVLDLFGLTDAVIARTRSEEREHGLPGHSRSNAAYVLERAPDYVIIGRGGGGWLPASQDLHAHPEFQRRYVWDPDVRAYRRRDLGAPEPRVPAAGEAARPRNVLLIVVDTLRFDHLGSYGAARRVSPAIDRIAEEGVRFERAYASAPWTKPSVASILTGLYPSSSDTGLPENALDARFETLAEMLSAHGFATHAIVSHLWLGAKGGFAQGFDAYDTEEIAGHDGFTTPGVTDRAVAALSRFAGGERPFFLFLHYFDPHYQYLDHADIDLAPERAGRLDGSEPINAIRRMRGIRPDEVAFLEQLYDEEIHATDAGIGRLMETLDALGLSDRTLVVLTADHGEEFFERGWLGHTRTLHEELIRVPLILRAPGIRPGVVRSPVSLVSLAPTILELLGLDPGARAFDGRSLAPLLRSDPAPEPGFVFAEVDFQPIFDPRKRAFKKAIVGERFKLIRDDRTGALELYDLVHDAGESRNLAGSRPEIARRLARLLEEHLQRARASGPVTAPEHSLTDEQREQLEALGYL